jgi:mRNA interferase MazF
MKGEKPARGEIWDVDREPVQGHEQGGRRPALIVSVTPFNQGASGLVIVLPISSQDKRVRTQIPIPAGEGGLNLPSFAKCEAILSISLERLLRRRGAVSVGTMEEVSDVLRILLGV